MFESIRAAWHGLTSAIGRAVVAGFEWYRGLPLFLAIGLAIVVGLIGSLLLAMAVGRRLGTISADYPQAPAQGSRGGYDAALVEQLERDRRPGRHRP